MGGVGGRSLGEEFCDLFPEVYLRFSRRPHKHDARLTPQAASILAHLSLSGPLTVGEMARHFDRAQSVVSEIVDGLSARGLLARMRDARDRRRVLVWLTDEALALLQREREVLDRARVAEAMAALGEDRAEALVDGMRALVTAPPPLAGPSPRASGPVPARLRTPRARTNPRSPKEKKP